MITGKSLNINFDEIKRLIYFEELGGDESNTCYTIQIETKNNTHNIVFTESAKEAKDLILIVQQILSVELAHVVNKGLLGIKEKAFDL